MNQSIELSLEERTELGSRAVRQLRKRGYVPTIVYGHDRPSLAMMAPYLEVAKVYREAGKHHPIELRLGDKTELAMIKDAEIDPVKHRLRHVAFHVVKQDEEVETEIPIVIDGKGSTPAERTGLVVIQTIETVEVSAKPRDLPNELHVDGEKLVKEGDKVLVADLAIPAGVTIEEDELSKTIASVYTTAALEAANDALAGDEEADASEVPSEEGQPDEEVNAEADEKVKAEGEKKKEE